MDSISLNKVISKLIVPKYPWIVDYDLSMYFNSGIENYTITYYIVPDKDGSFTVSEELGQLEKLTYNLFKILGPERHQIIDSINFEIVKRK